MQNILYANPFSLFDYTSGSANSIRLFLENIRSLGFGVYSICSCTSYSKSGFLNTLDISKNNNDGNFLFKGINCKIIKSQEWERRKLTLNEEKVFLKETILLMNNIKFDLIIGWGNLNLEESIFKEAKKLGIKICFYLVNPSYLNKDFYLKDNADFIITDSVATKKLYQNFIKKRILVLPKCLENTSTKYSSNSNSKKCLIINPSINKGLEPLIFLSKKLEESRKDISFWLVDGRKTIYEDLNYLGYKRNQIPKNIVIFPACKDINKLYENIQLVLLLSIWHESGSRVILESYSHGKPVICFDVGGNKEFIKENKKDIFKPPKLFRDVNGRLRLKSWEYEDIFSRVISLLDNEDYYDEYSKLIFKSNKVEYINTKFNSFLLQFLKKI